MIRVTKLNKKEEFYINPELIETIEMTPDTVISLTTQKKFIVAENIDELLERIVDYYRIVNSVPPQIVFNPRN